MSKRRSKQRKPNWLWLHDDLLELILKKLSYPDLVRFSAVCSSWRISAKSFNAVSRPILLLTIPSDQNYWCFNSLSLKIFIVGEDKVIHNLFGPGTSRRYRKFYCVGYSNSMLVLTGRASSLKPVVLNPFSRRKFYLPRINIQDFPHSPFDLSYFAEHTMIEIRKAVVLSRSNSIKNLAPLVLVIIYAFYGEFTPFHMAYCELGRGRSWAHLSSKEDNETSFEDMVCRDGRLYVLTSCNAVEVWDFNRHKPVMVSSLVPIRKKFPTSQKLINGDSIIFFKAYLVASIIGEILLVRRWISCGDEAATVKFDVYEMRLGGEGHFWEKVKSLGSHRVLFLGLNESMLVSTTNFAGCPGNSIYFVLSLFSENEYRFYSSGNDIGVYSLQHKAVNSFYKSRPHNFDTSLFWLIPNPL